MTVLAAASARRLDKELLRRHDLPVPRYTSYPPANRFREPFPPSAYRRLLAESAAERRPLALYVHVPFCAARCLFCGCNVTVARERGRADAYLDAVAREAALVAALAAAADRAVVQMHWGGGTPTFLDAPRLLRLAGILQKSFPLAAAAEMAVEIDPRHCDSTQLEALVAAGVNRLSLGVQDLDPRVQAAIRREQRFEQLVTLVEAARARGIAAFNLDLVYGLPHQTPASFARTLAAVLRLAPERLALFSFAYVPEVLRHQRALDPAALPPPELRWEIFTAALETLTAAGYVHLGLDHFARPDDPLARAAAAGTLARNFQGYTPRGDCDLIGLGASAIGQLSGGYAQNRRTVGEYQAAVAEDGLATWRGVRLDPDQRLRRELIHALLCAGRIDIAEVEARFGCAFERRFASELAALAALAADGLVALSATTIALTARGRLLARRVASVFDPEAGEAGGAHARAV